MEQGLTTYPTWERYTVLSHHVLSLGVRERRMIFTLTRTCPHASPDLFFPEFGITLAEFATWHVLGDRGRKKAQAAADRQ